MKHRFRFFGSADSTGKIWTLDDDEVVHARSVLRIPEGDVVEVTNGQGLWASGLIKYSGKNCLVECEVSFLENRPSRTFGLAIGALKPSTMDDLLPSITELGVSEILIYLSKGVEKNRINPKSSERWQKIIRSSTKQCKRFFLPQIKTITDMDQLLESTLTYESRWLGFPGGQSPLAIPNSDSILSVLGSEKGLDPEEESKFLNSGFLPVSFGLHILRAETACIAASTLMQAKLAN